MIGSVRVRTRDEKAGPRSGYLAGGGAVALMVELMSFHRSLPVSAPLSSYNCGKSSECYGMVMLFRRSETS